MDEARRKIYFLFLLGVLSISLISTSLYYYFYLNPVFLNEREPKRLFWVYPTDLNYAEEVILNYGEKIDNISPTLYSVAENGSIFSSWLQSSANNQSLLNFLDICNENSKEINPLIACGNSTLSRLLLENNTKIDNFIISVNNSFEIYNYSGVNIDFEHVDEDLKDEFNQFFKKLKDNIPEDKILSIDSPAITSYLTSGWGSWFDFNYIGKIADEIMIMTYDAHGGWTGPGEVAPTSWVKRVLAYTIKVVPIEKIYVGIPRYGYDWSEDDQWQNVGFGYQFFRDRKILFDGTETRTEDGYELKLEYQDDSGYQHIAYYCDSETTLKKEKFLRNYPVAGYCYWHLGCGDPEYFEKNN